MERYSYRKVCIIGCTNIGKSSIFNRLIGKKIAITYDREGVTVDCREESASINEYHLTVVDTPGFDECHESSDHTLQDKINETIKIQISESDAIIHIIDASNGHNIHDKIWAERYQKANKKTLIVANKIDISQGINESCYRIGNSEVVGASAKTGEGIKKIKQWIESIFKSTEKTEKSDNLENDQSIQFCIVGKPNSGKSTLINKLCKKNISQTCQDAGTTTDTVKSKCMYRDKIFTIYDTAGMRKKTKVKDTVEQYSTYQTLETIKNVKGTVVHMIDGTIGISDQDLKIIETIKLNRKKHIIVVNKWDKLNNEQKKLYKKNIEHLTHNNRHIPIIFMSAYYGKNLSQLMNMISRMSRQDKIPPMSFLTKNIETITRMHPPPLVNGKQVKIRVAYPNHKKAMCIIIQGKRVSKINKSYKSYIKNSMQKSLNIIGIELDIVYKEDANPYTS
ncbi:MAG: ribosome biogenesis GTPase Der [Pseudomonadota bacterium]|nr:ribosome biogenesis GTPase Der [Pseudomonadota bacterium]